MKMLVLSRKQHERLIIDENIVVTIIRVSGGTVRVGIEAPSQVSIRREELHPRSLDDREGPVASRCAG
jgi:carbon storage regulator